MSEKINQGNLLVTLNLLLDEINYAQWLQEQSKTSAAAERKMKNVYELIEWLDRMSGVQPRRARRQGRGLGDAEIRGRGSFDDGTRRAHSENPVQATRQNHRLPTQGNGVSGR